MALLKIGKLNFDADLVVFDKDGTLIDLEALWGRLAVDWVTRLAAAPGQEAVADDLYSSFGYDPERGRILPQSPLAIATIGQLRTIAASILYRRGMPWTDAEDCTKLAFERPANAPLADWIRPTGDLPRLMRQLQDANVRVAVVTTDDRQETEETLQILGITDLVDHIVCGDDGLPWKPAPDAFQFTCERLGIDPTRTVVIGDTEADLLMANRGGAGFKVAVTESTENRPLLKAIADVAIRSVDEITVQC